MTAAWRRASYSGPQGWNCVGAATWRKASYSNGIGNCVEAGHGRGVVGVRESQLGDGSPVLEVSPAAWRGFLAGLR